MTVGYSGSVTQQLKYSRGGVPNYAFEVTQSATWGAHSDSAVLVRQLPGGGLAILNANLDGHTATHVFETSYNQAYYDQNGNPDCLVASGSEQPSHPFQFTMVLHVDPTDPDRTSYALGLFSPSTVSSSVSYAVSEAGVISFSSTGCPPPCPINVLLVNPADHPTDSNCRFTGGTAMENLPAEYRPDPQLFADATQTYLLDHLTSGEKTVLSGRLGHPQIEIRYTNLISRPNGPYDPHPNLPPDPTQSWEASELFGESVIVHLTLCPQHGLRPCSTGGLADSNEDTERRHARSGGSRPRSAT